MNRRLRDCARQALLGLFLVLALNGVSPGVAGTLAREHRAQAGKSSIEESDFCDSRKLVNDFGISQLPPVYEVPESGDIPFGPETLSIEMTHAPILAPGEVVGVVLSNDGRRVSLHLSIRARIRPVDAMGQPGAVVARSRVRVPKIRAQGQSNELFLRPPDTTGFYRYDLEIVRFGGQLLQNYSGYLRVENKFWDARVGLNHQKFHAGALVLSRVENFGTEAIEYGEPFHIQAYRNEKWVHVHNPHGGAWAAWAGFAPPGLPGRQCSYLRLPSDFPPGEYRMVKWVTRAITGEDFSPNELQGRYVAAPFEVVGMGLSRGGGGVFPLGRQPHAGEP